MVGPGRVEWMGGTRGLLVSSTDGAGWNRVEPMVPGRTGGGVRKVGPGLTGGAGCSWEVGRDEFQVGQEVEFGRFCLFCRSGMVVVCRGFRGEFRVIQAVEFGRFYLFCQSGMVVIGREVGRGE